MAEGIVRRHAKSCPSRAGKRCRCNSGWEAWVYLRREKRKVRRTFPTKGEAKTWRSEALTAARKGELRRAPTEHRTVYESLVDFVAGMESGEIRPKKKERYKPNTIRSYERAVRLRYKDSELGALRPSEVRRSDVQSFADELLASMSGRSASNALNPLQAFYRRANDGKSWRTSRPRESTFPPAGPSDRAGSLPPQKRRA
jgi:hypothetical protein